MKKKVLFAAALLIASPALAEQGDRQGGPHGGAPAIPSTLMRQIADFGTVAPLGREGGGSQRMANQTQTFCGTDNDGNPITITATYRFSALAGEYRLDRRSLTAVSGCSSSTPHGSSALAANR